MARKRGGHRGGTALPVGAHPTAAALRLTGATPAVSSSAVVVHAVPTAASLRLTGFAPTVVTDRTVAARPTAGALVLTGARPAVTTTAGSAPTEQPAGTLQAFINGVTTGATGNVPLGIYRESVTVSRAMTLVFAAGTRIYGSDTSGNKVRKRAITVTASSVTLNFTAGNIRFGSFQLGSFPNDAVISIENGATFVSVLGTVANSGGVMDLNHGSYAGVSFPGGTNNGNDSTVDGMTFIDAPGPGVRIWGEETRLGAKRITVSNNSFINCSAAAWSVLDPAHPGYLMGDGTRLDAGNESGGMKAGGYTDFVVEYNVFDHCNGNALWLDVYGLGGTIRFNTVHHAWRSGIMVEISSTTDVHDNKVWECGWEANQLYIWGAGILSSSAKASTIHANYVAWCREAVSFIAQDRGALAPGTSGDTGTGNFLGQTSGPAIGTFGPFDSPVPVISPNTIVAAGSGTWTGQGIPASPEAGH